MSSHLKCSTSLLFISCRNYGSGDLNKKAHSGALQDSDIKSRFYSYHYTFMYSWLDQDTVIDIREEKDQDLQCLVSNSINEIILFTLTRGGCTKEFEAGDSLNEIT